MLFGGDDWDDEAVVRQLAENAKRPPVRFEDYGRAVMVPIEIECAFVFRPDLPVTRRAACRV